MVLFIVVYEETISISEVMDVSDFVTNNNIIKYYKTNRTIRKLIMCLPNWLFKSPTRIVFIKSTKEKLKLFPEQLSIPECKEADNLSETFENNTIYNNSGIARLISKQPDIIIHNRSHNSFNEISSEYRIKQLEQQLFDIKEQIKEIYFILANRDKSNLSFGIQNQNDKSDKENILPPPPAPPLPPTISGVQYKTPDRKKCNIQSQEISTKTVPTMADVLKEMNKVKLKPVQRTPGGRPMKSLPRNLSESNNFSPDLQSVLKRRYSAMHNISPKTPETPVLKKSNSQDSFYDNF